jgi:hypothetical protein
VFAALDVVLRAVAPRQVEAAHGSIKTWMC